MHAVGLTDTVTMRSCEEALRWLGSNRPAAVVLDLFLADGDCFPVLERVSGARIPAIVYSGTEQPADWAQGNFADIAWIEKPADPANVASLLTAKVSA